MGHIIWLNQFKTDSALHESLSMPNEQFIDVICPSELQKNNFGSH